MPFLDKLNDTTYRYLDEGTEIVVGDEKQADFYPRIKIKKWGNACNISVGIDGSSSSNLVTVAGNRLTWSGQQEAIFYPIEDDSNIVRDKISWIHLENIDPYTAAAAVEMLRSLPLSASITALSFTLSGPALFFSGQWPAEKYARLKATLSVDTLALLVADDTPITLAAGSVLELHDTTDSYTMADYNGSQVKINKSNWGNLVDALAIDFDHQNKSEYANNRPNFPTRRDIPAIRLAMQGDRPIYVDQGVVTIVVNNGIGNPDDSHTEAFVASIMSAIADAGLTDVTEHAQTLNDNDGYFLVNIHFDSSNTNTKFVSVCRSNGLMFCVLSIDGETNKVHDFYQQVNQEHIDAPVAHGVSGSCQATKESIVPAIAVEFSNRIGYQLLDRDLTAEENNTVTKLLPVQRTFAWVEGSNRPDPAAFIVGTEKAYEFSVGITSPPPNNRIAFSVLAKNCEFQYQTPPTREAKLYTQIPPSKLDGGYIILARDSIHEKTTTIGYHDRELCRLDRPIAIDCHGNKYLCNIEVVSTTAPTAEDITAIVEVVLPIALADSSLYPIILDPTFGYSGNTGLSASAFDTVLGLTASPTSNGRLIYMDCSVFIGAANNPVKRKAAVYQESTITPGTYTLLAKSALPLYEEYGGAGSGLIQQVTLLPAQGGMQSQEYAHRTASFISWHRFYFTQLIRVSRSTGGPTNKYPGMTITNIPDTGNPAYFKDLDNLRSDTTGQAYATNHYDGTASLNYYTARKIELSNLNFAASIPANAAIVGVEVKLTGKTHVDATTIRTVNLKFEGSPLTASGYRVSSEISNTESTVVDGNTHDIWQQTVNIDADYSQLNASNIRKPSFSVTLELFIACIARPIQAGDVSLSNISVSVYYCDPLKEVVPIVAGRNYRLCYTSMTGTSLRYSGVAGQSFTYNRAYLGTTNVEQDWANTPPSVTNQGSRTYALSAYYLSDFPQSISDTSTAATPLLALGAASTNILKASETKNTNVTVKQGTDAVNIQTPSTNIGVVPKTNTTNISTPTHNANIGSIKSDTTNISTPTHNANIGSIKSDTTNISTPTHKANIGSIKSDTANISTPTHNANIGSIKSDTTNISTPTHNADLGSIKSDTTNISTPTHNADLGSIKSDTVTTLDTKKIHGVISKTETATVTTPTMVLGVAPNKDNIKSSTPNLYLGVALPAEILAHSEKNALSAYVAIKNTVTSSDAISLGIIKSIIEVLNFINPRSIIKHGRQVASSATGRDNLSTPALALSFLDSVLLTPTLARGVSSVVVEQLTLLDSFLKRLSKDIAILDGIAAVDQALKLSITRAVIEEIKADSRVITDITRVKQDSINLSTQNILNTARNTLDTASISSQIQLSAGYAFIDAAIATDKIARSLALSFIASILSRDSAPLYARLTQLILTDSITSSDLLIGIDIRVLIRDILAIAASIGVIVPTVRLVQFAKELLRVSAFKAENLSSPEFTAEALAVSKFIEELLTDKSKS